MSPERARKILNLKPEDGLDDARAAFRARVKRLHPDRAGARRRAAYEETIAAWRTLQAQARPEQPAPAPEPAPIHIEIGVPAIAVRLGETIEAKTPYRRIRIALPTGARSGERLRLKGRNGEPDVIVTLRFDAHATFAEALRRFTADFAHPHAGA